MSNHKFYDLVRTGDMSLDSFMKVYEEFEAKDKERKLAELQK